MNVLVQKLNQPSASDASVLVLSSEQYCPVFVSLMLRHWKRISGHQVQRLDLESAETASIISKLDMSFLGQTIVYWCGSLDALDAKKRMFWQKYFALYTGPHIVICFTKDAQELNASQSVEAFLFPESVTMQDYDQLRAWLYPNSRENKTFTGRLFRISGTLVLDQACIMMQYQAVVGSKSSDFFEQWLEKILIPDHSLFRLSEYFFGKNKQQFLAMWQDVSHEFPDQFWIAFWSEQLWRASCYVFLQQQKNNADAKKIAHRLPFSFINKDWRRHTYEHLKDAHAQLVDADFQLKYGGTSAQLDRFYLEFFKMSQ
ncbi:hypothetical protein JW872_00300 [Candidatus Babeliales bacterium]|nr:hypothetical protein [Candidatus Babeliales bacterium]